MAVSLFRLIGSIGRSMVVTNTLGSFSLLIVFVLGGFIIAKRDIHPWWIWAYWISPLRCAECGTMHISRLQVGKHMLDFLGPLRLGVCVHSTVQNQVCRTR